MNQLKVLVVDDNLDLAKILNIYLEDAGYEVTVAYNGVDALEAFKSGYFDAVFLDVKLPDMSGIEVFQEIYKMKPQIRVFMMTGYRCEQLISDVVENGTVQILRTQSEIERFSETLEKLENQSIVVILDSTPDIVKRVSGYLADRGVSALLADDSQQAIDNVLKKPVEFLLLDLGKPMFYSLGVYVELKKQGHAVKTVIFASGSSNGDETSDILQSTTFTSCLFKPFDPEILLELLQKEFPG